MRFRQTVVPALAGWALVILACFAPQAGAATATADLQLPPARGLDSPPLAVEEHTAARIWIQELLDAIRRDLARPTVHARNLHQVSAAMWDAWAAYDRYSDGLIHLEDATADTIPAARREAISYAAFRIIGHRFQNSPGAEVTLPALHDRLLEMGYDPDFTSTAGNSPAALGNRIAASVLAHGLADGANEAGNYANQYYQPLNEPLYPILPGNQDMEFPNHWQPLALDAVCDQIGNVCFPTGAILPHLSPEWGHVAPFGMGPEQLDIHPTGDGWEWWVWLDPGPPPLLNGPGDEEFRAGFVQVVEFSSFLDPSDGVTWEISPATFGDNTLGTNDGNGYDFNPITGEPYQPQLVPRGDYTRVLAEFWADGPDSYTPPGHWYAILNYVSDHPLFEKRWMGEGEVLDDLEWDVRTYLALGGAVHDAAVAAWSVKGFYDYVRPISAIRYMAEQGQSSDPAGPSYHPDGIPLVPGLIEVITEQSSVPGKHHEHLAEFVGEIALYAWFGFPFDKEEGRGMPEEPLGVHWIRAGEWWPFQRPTFVSPPFAGYVSGHSTFSRAAAEAMTLITGSRYFPGGLGEFHAEANEFLHFEPGPSVDVTLQWAAYQDAADECSLSRIYGGIHPTQDDIPGRLMGFQAGHLAVERASGLITGERIFVDRFQ